MSWIPKKLWVQFLILWIVLAVLFVMIISGQVRIGCKGVCVDSAGKIYVGLEEEIRVFDEKGLLLRVISPQTSKGYEFAIDGEMLIVNANGNTYFMDLEGKLLSTVKESQALSSRKDAVAVNGSVYHISASSLYYRVSIEQNGAEKVPVQMPFFDLLAEGVFLAWSVFFVILFMRVMFLFRQHSKRGNKSHSRDSSPVKG